MVSVLCVDVKSGGQLWPGWRGRPAQPSPGPPWPGWALTTTVVVTVVTRLMVMVMVVVVVQHVRCQRCGAPLPGPRTPHTATSPHLCSQYKTSPYMGQSDCWAGLCVISRQLHAVL